MVIWGEYDSGRVLGHFTLPDGGPETSEQRYEKLLASPGELSTAINADLPEDVRYLALLSLSQVYVQKGDIERARAILTQALTRPPGDPPALATLYFLLGYVQQIAKPADLDAAIDAYHFKAGNVRARVPVNGG